MCRILFLNGQKGNFTVNDILVNINFQNIKIKIFGIFYYINSFQKLHLYPLISSSSSRKVPEKEKKHRNYKTSSRHIVVPIARHADPPSSSTSYKATPLSLVKFRLRKTEIGHFQVSGYCEVFRPPEFHQTSFRDTNGTVGFVSSSSSFSNCFWPLAHRRCLTI
ncbi:hypothetical protein PanWU01x14_131000 [Parasponia andersonii]|uniref:Uncharacterized protein n=1 Tax=Parasponia andersonii TaxID=3476 RepID=A0A2P5CR15_PARAD|nr:hypothetical protein PanWU01x14_131000 [Parasponia andersonii]